jgi:polyribonucleotide nucleotidyltransferase
LPEIIGKAGANIKAIQERSGARVVVPSSPSAAPGAKDRGENLTKIAIAGPREGVALAKEIIKEITEVFHHPVTHPGVVHNTVEVPERYYNVIIGAKGSEIRHIQNNFKVSVKIPNETTSFRDVMVLGQPAECEAAIRYIQKLVEKVQEKEQMRENEKFAGDEEEAYDEDLMNRYVYSRQNRSGDAEPATQESSSPPRRTVSSERPPGFSPLNKADGEGSQPAVPMVWGSAAAPQSWGPVK